MPPATSRSSTCYRATIVRCANLNSPLKNGSATVPRDWATRRSQSLDSTMENGFHLAFVTLDAAATYTEAANCKIARTGIAIIGHRGPSSTLRTG